MDSVLFISPQKCDKAFSTDAGLQQHLKRVHETRPSEKHSLMHRLSHNPDKRSPRQSKGTLISNKLTPKHDIETREDPNAKFERREMSKNEQSKDNVQVKTETDADILNHQRVLESENNLQLELGSSLQLESENNLQLESRNNLQLMSESNLQLQSGNNLQLESGNNLQLKSGNNLQLMSENNLQLQSGNNLQLVSGNNLQIHNCPGCYDTFKTTSGLRRHLCSVHPKVFKKEFKSFENITTSGFKPSKGSLFYCQLCKDHFSNISDLHIHIFKYHALREPSETSTEEVQKVIYNMAKPRELKFEVENVGMTQIDELILEQV